VEITESRQGAVTVVKPVGPLCSVDAPAFKSRMAEATSMSLGRLVIDAAGIAFVDSEGLEALLDASEQLGASGQTLKLCGLNETVREVLELTGLTDGIEHYDDVHAAVRSFL
jgi:anti-anti-sigma factor